MEMAAVAVVIRAGLIQSHLQGVLASLSLKSTNNNAQKY
jgi:hypothetical protein